MTDDITYYLDNRERSGEQGISPHRVSACFRQSAYRIFETEPTNERPHGAADLGTLLHLGWAAMIAASYPAEVRAAEVELQLDELTRRGFADDVDFANRIVTDLKSGKAVVWQGWVNRGVPPDHWDQTEVYALALRRMYGGDWTMRIVALNRETGERAEFYQDADPERGLALVAKAAARERSIRLGKEQGQTPEQFPREGRGPGRGYPCDYCEFLDRCWPPLEPGDPRSPQSATIAGDPEAIAQVLADYSEAAHTASKAKNAQGDARSFLTGLPAGTYGDFRLGWTGGNDRGMVPDCDAMTEVIPRLAAAIIDLIGVTCPSHAEPLATCPACQALELLDGIGLPYPMKHGGATPVTINVTRVPQRKKGPATVQVPLLAESGPGVVTAHDNSDPRPTAE